MQFWAYMTLPWGHLRSHQVGLGKVPLTNEGFRKLTEVSINERQKPERISRFWKNINNYKRKQNGFFVQPNIAFNF